MGNTGIVPDSQVQIDGNAIRITVQNLPVSLRGKTLDLFPETPEVIETAANAHPGLERRGLDGQCAAVGPAQQQPVGHAGGAGVAGNEAYRAELKVLGTWPTVAAAGHGVARAGRGAQGQCRTNRQCALSAVPGTWLAPCWAPCWAG